MEKYRYIGLKLTPQRLAILNYLEGNTGHPSAEDIYRAVHKKFPTMSLATVYNTLSALKAKGNVLELTLDPDKKRYDPDTGQHDHLICISCRRIVDIPGAYRFDLSDGERRDFTVLERHIEYYGFCPRCKKDKDKQTKEAVYVRRS